MISQPNPWKDRYLHMTHVNRYKLLSMPVLCKKDVVEDIKLRSIAKKTKDEDIK